VGADIDPTVFTLGHEVVFHQGLVITVGIEELLEEEQVNGAVFVDFEFGDQLFVFNVPDPHLRVNSCCYQVLVVDDFQFVNDSRLVDKHFEHLAIDRVVEKHEAT